MVVYEEKLTPYKAYMSVRQACGKKTYEVFLSIKNTILSKTYTSFWTTCITQKVPNHAYITHRVHIRQVYSQVLKSDRFNTSHAEWDRYDLQSVRI